MEEYKELFVNNINVQTGTVDLVEWVEMIERNHDIEINSKWKTVHSLYCHTIKNLYQFLILHETEKLDYMITKLVKFLPEEIAENEVAELTSRFSFLHPQDPLAIVSLINLLGDLTDEC